MASRFQSATLVASPSYPNSIAWSDENLIAVASGHLVTILVLDITDMLYDYLASISFEEPDIPPSEISKSTLKSFHLLLLGASARHDCVDDPPDSVSGKEHRRRRVNTSGVRG